MNALLHLDAKSPPRSLVWEQPMSDEEFEALCMANDVFTLERTRAGEIIVNAPAGGSMGDGNSEIDYQLGTWWKTHRRGRAATKPEAEIDPVLYDRLTTWLRW